MIELAYLMTLAFIVLGGLGLFLAWFLNKLRRPTSRRTMPPRHPHTQDISQSRGTPRL